MIKFPTRAGIEKLKFRIEGKLRDLLGQPPLLTMQQALDNKLASRDVRWQLATDSTTPLPSDNWATFDRTPWSHPWLTRENLAAFRHFSDDLLDRWLVGTRARPTELDVAFVGNMANLNYTRLAPLRRLGVKAPLYLHWADESIFARPEWEEFDGTLPFGAPLTSFPERMSHVPDVVTPPVTPDWYLQDLATVAPFIKAADVVRWPSSLSNLNMYRALAAHQVIVASQIQYAAYFSGRPYVFGQSGGEIWHEPSRDDELGRFQLLALHKAAAIFVSNPLTLAHARRYGLRNLIYFPYCIDEQIYAPGPAEFRDEWTKVVGGDFFVIMSARVDNVWKGSQIALEGFAKFARNHAGARLVVMRWGQQSHDLDRRLDELGISDRVLVQPLAGKRRLIKYLRSADCLMEQFVLGYYGGSALEAMACGLPVVMRLERAQYEGLLHGDAPPTLDAASPDEVVAGLERLYLNPSLLANSRTATRAWFLRNHAGGSQSYKFCRLLQKVGTGAVPNYQNSPLGTRLSQCEVDYHRDQLANAPRFPNYV